MTKPLPVILLNFSGVYDYESFTLSRDIVHVDCRGLNGVDCYCDAEDREALHRMLEPYPVKAHLMS